MNNFPSLSFNDPEFKAYVVHLILNKETEKAVSLVSKKHSVRTPKLEIGISKGKKKALGVYSVSANAISFKDQTQFFNPFVVLHEMYHCIRSSSGSHRGNEKNADRFALDYIGAYNEMARRALGGVVYETDKRPEVD
ncbi:MAG TPA: hypothetical protein VFF30_13255 [Nitrososphaerales archaeon]|nr:hypothetical protein [Nitrososphaerales archaeon]